MTLNLQDIFGFNQDFKNLLDFFIHIHIVFISYSCYNIVPQKLTDLTEFSFLIVLESRSLKSRCWQALLPLKPLCALTIPRFWWFVSKLQPSLVYRCITLIPCLHMVFSLCLHIISPLWVFDCIQMSLFYKDTSHTRLGPS